MARWMSIREAALALGVSELTVRRRIKDGKLVHRSENGKYYVDLTAVPAETTSSPSHLRPVPTKSGGSSPHAFVRRGMIQGETVTDQVDVVDQIDHEDVTDQNSGPDSTQTEGDAGPGTGAGTASGLDLHALLREHARLAEVAGRASAIEEQLRHLEARHSVLQDGVISLSNRNGWLESRLEQRESEIKLLTDSRHRLPWWKRLFGSGPAGAR